MGKSSVVESLLNDLKTKFNSENTSSNRTLANTIEVWSRIGSGDSFAELNFEDEEGKKEFFEKWTKENEYSNI